MAWGSRRSPGRSPAKAARPSSSPPSTRAAPRARCSPAPPSTCSTACCPGAEPHYAGFDLRPVLSSLAEVRDWAAYSRARGRRLAAAIHIDTGINRLGMPESEVDQLAAEPDAAGRLRDHAGHEPPGLRRRTPTDPMNERQRERFEELRAKLPPAPASLANSGGTFLGPAYHFDLVRPGIALYGGRAHEDKPNPMQHGGAARRQDPAGARGRPRRHRRLRRHLQGAASPRASPPSPSATPTASCAP